MNRFRSGTVVTWRTAKTRKMRRAEAYCADYGLIPMHKALHIGSLYKDERTALEEKLRLLLCGKHDRYHIFTLCASCAVRLGEAYTNTENVAPYEIV